MLPASTRNEEKKKLLADSCLYIFLKENVFTWAWMSALADAHVNVGQAIGKCSKSLELWAFETIAFIRTSTEVPIVSLLRPTISSWDTNRLSNLLFDLLLREKRLQAIKEKPSLAVSWLVLSSFEWSLKWSSCCSHSKGKKDRQQTIGQWWESLGYKTAHISLSFWMLREGTEAFKREKVMLSPRDSFGSAPRSRV